MGSTLKTLCFCLLVALSAATAAVALETQPAQYIWTDIDNDGMSDVLVVHPEGCRLFRNLGGEDLEDVTVLFFTNGPEQFEKGFFADFNGDGWCDLFLQHRNGVTVFSNESGYRFTDRTEAVGLNVALRVVHVRPYDFDKDGFADLLVRTRTGERIFRNIEGDRFVEVSLPRTDGCGVAPQGWIAGRLEGTEKPGCGDGSESPIEGDMGAFSPDTKAKTTSRPVPGASGHTSRPSSSVSRGWPVTPAQFPASATVSGPGGVVEPSLQDDRDWEYKANAPHMWARPSGNVGIGTSAPDHKLEVVDGSSSSTSSELLELESRSTHVGGDARLRFSLRNSSSVDRQGEIIAYKSDGDGVNYLIRTNNDGTVVDAVTIEKGGDVGIGTRDPDSPAHVDGGADASLSQGGYVVSGDLSDLNLVFDDDEILARENGAPAPLYLNSEGGGIRILTSGSGQVGLGTRNPSERLDIQDANGEGALRLGDTSGSNAGTIRWTGSDFEGCTGSSWVSLASEQGSCYWTQNGQDISFTGGDVCIGGAVPFSELDVWGTLTGTGLVINGGAGAVTGSGFDDWDKVVGDDLTRTATFGGDVSGTFDSLTVKANTVDAAEIKANAVNESEIQTGAVGSSELASTTVSAGTYGSGTQVTGVTVDSDGRITYADTTGVDGLSLEEHVYFSVISGGDDRDLITRPAQAWKNYFFKVELLVRATEDWGDGEVSVWLLAAKTESNASSFDDSGKSTITRSVFGSYTSPTVWIENSGGYVRVKIENNYTGQYDEIAVEATITAMVL